MSIVDKNKKFLNLLQVSGMLNKLPDKSLRELENSKLDLLEVSNKFKAYLREYRGNAPLDVLYHKILLTCSFIKSRHDCEDFNEFLDRFFDIYVKVVPKSKRINLEEINNKLSKLNSFERYKITFDSLKVQLENQILPEYKHENKFPIIRMSDDSKVHGYMCKDNQIIKIGNVADVGIDDDYAYEWVWVKNTRDILNILLKRDYDYITLPYIPEKNMLDLLDNCDINGMSNNDLIDILVVLRCLNAPSSISTLYKLDKLGDSELDLKELMLKLLIWENYKRFLGRTGVVLFLLKVNELELKTSKEYARSRIKLMSNMLDYSVKNIDEEVSNKIEYSIPYKQIDSLDDLVITLKLLDVSKIYNVRLNNKFRMLLNLADMKLNSDNSYLIYADGKVKKTKNIEKGLKDDSVYFVIVPNRKEMLEKLKR